MLTHPLMNWNDLTGSIWLGYLLGSIPFGLIFARLAGAGDVRKIGSGNIGATNVLRTGNKWAAALTLIFDAAKGAAAVLIAGAFYGRDAAVIAGLGAFLGHIFPVWLSFKGGKGVATFLGVMLALAWPVGLATAATWLAAAALWRISSLSALIAAALAPLYMWMWGEPLAAALAAVLAIILFITHWANITRILSGSEPHIGHA